MITVNLAREAKPEWAAIPKLMQDVILNTLHTNAPKSHEQDVVVSWTWECPDHIYRRFKITEPRPGYRIIYHHTAWNSIVIDRICRRDNDPYGDGG